MAGFQKTATGTGILVNTTAEDATIIAAQGVGTVIRVQKVFIAVTLAATGGGGFVGLEDGVGGTRFVNISAAALGVYPIDFGDEGFPLTANVLLNATVDGATTNEATATVTIVAKVA